MKITEMNENHKYIIKNYGNLKADEIHALNEVGFIEGEIIKNNLNIKCSSKVCFFTIDNSNFSVNVKYINEVEIEEVYE